MGRLASGIAHDFNNLLTIVLNLTDLVRACLDAHHPTQGDLAKIGDAAGRAAVLAAQLLTIGKKKSASSKPIAAKQVARRTLELLRSSLPGTIRVQADLEGPELFVDADETQFQQVLMNLCLNAREAMPTGGDMSVSVEAVTAPSSAGGDKSCAEWVRLSVDDSGAGIAEQLRESIFDPFFSTKERGTGLGLAVVRQIAEGCGGRVEVRSQPGAGTRFEVWLPRCAATAVPPPITRSAQVSDLAVE